MTAQKDQIVVFGQLLGNIVLLLCLIKEFIKADGSFDCVILTNDKKAFVTEGLKDSFSLKNREYEIIIV